MPDETPRPPDPATRRIVKKTVAKPVVRPQSAASRWIEPPAETSAPSAPPRTRAAVQSRPTPSAKDRLVGRARRPEEQAPVRERRPRPTIDLSAVAGSFGQRVRSGAGRTRTGVTGTARRGGLWFRDRYDDAVLWSMPQQPPIRAAVITGLVVGLLVTVLGWLSLLMFSAVRGVATGGGVWGSLVVVLIAVIAAVIGDRLLRSMGTEHAAAITAVGIMTAIVLILAFFLGPASGPWAWLIVPGVSLVGFVLAERLMSMSGVDVGTP